MDEIQPGEIWWADLPKPRRSEPGFRRPVLVVQADSFNRSGFQTALIAVVTRQLELAGLHLVIPCRALLGPPRDSVVEMVSQLPL